jgi:uncharacterized lipoprotein YajG
MIKLLTIVVAVSLLTGCIRREVPAVEMITMLSPEQLFALQSRCEELGLISRVVTDNRNRPIVAQCHAKRTPVNQPVVVKPVPLS